VVSFPGWKIALSQSSLIAGVKGAYENQILSLLRHCKRQHTAITVGVVKHYLTGLSNADIEEARTALRRFFRASRNPVLPAATADRPADTAPAPSRPQRALAPLPAKADLGGAD
jgi:hypothetical protein